MIIKRRICRGYVVDASVGQPLYDGNIIQLDIEGRELSRKRPDQGRQWRLILDENCVSSKFDFPGYTSKIIEKSAISQRNARIKLLPDAPVGYAGIVDCRPGDKIDLHVHSPRTWKVSLYRHGLKRELILESGLHPPILQKVPDCSFVAKGLDWPVSTIIELPHSLLSGLLSVNITDTLGKSFTFPLVMTPPENNDQAQVSFAVIGNTNTWQAYNIWGGKSRYRNFDKNPLNGAVPLPMTQTDNSYTWRRVKTGVVRRVFRFWRYFMRAAKGSSIRVDVSGIRLEPGWVTDPLSARRPMPNRWLSAESPYSGYLDHLAANEWRALAWLERENFSYHYFSDRQLHTGDIDFSQYRGIVLVGHAEYWSREMYERLHTAVFKDGVPLLNLAGNAIYQEVEFIADGGIAPKHGDFLETCSDSSEVLCVATDLSVSGFAAFRLDVKSHWAIANVQNELAGPDKDLMGINSLIDLNLVENNEKYDPHAPGLLRGDMYGRGASGWEVDKLCKACHPFALVLARGLNKGGGADMILVENTNQRFLFCASSIAYVSSLLVDEPCSQLTRNVFEKISAAPHSSQHFSDK